MNQFNLISGKDDRGLDDPRRRWLIQALSAGVFTTALADANAQGFSIFGSRPQRLPPTQSIYGLAGQVTVNDTAATLATRIKAGDTVETGKNSEIIFVVNTHSMILRGDSKLVIEPSADTGAVSTIIAGLRMISGKLLSVSRNAPMRLSTSTSTIGIRGTGFYVEADPDLTYFCTCYGATQVTSNSDPQSTETIAASHHDRPVYIAREGAEGRKIRNAPFLNHTDQELSLIETLVGRRVPFVFGKDTYTAPRRTY
jgi:hypothetical protein